MFDLRAPGKNVTSMAAIIGACLVAGAAALMAVISNAPGETGQSAGPAATGAPPPGTAPPEVSLAMSPRPGREGEVSSPSDEYGVTAQAEPAAQPARANGGEVTFIVRLKDAPEVDVIAQSFRRDRSSANAAWAELTNKFPVLRDYELTGASYSGEMKLTRRLPAGERPTPSVVEKLRGELLAIEGVAYADPDYIAHPNTEDLP